jgi:hypothetical protein
MIMINTAYIANLMQNKKDDASLSLYNSQQDIEVIKTNIRDYMFFSMVMVNYYIKKLNNYEYNNIIIWAFAFGVSVFVSDFLYLKKIKKVRKTYDEFLKFLDIRIYPILEYVSIPLDVSNKIEKEADKLIQRKKKKGFLDGEHIDNLLGAICLTLGYYLLKYANFDGAITCLTISFFAAKTLTAIKEIIIY